MRLPAHPLHVLVVALLFPTLARAQVGSTPQLADLIVTNACVVAMNDRKDIHENGVVIIKDSRQ